MTKSELKTAITRGRDLLNGGWEWGRTQLFSSWSSGDKTACALGFAAVGLGLVSPSKATELAEHYVVGSQGEVYGLLDQRLGEDFVEEVWKQNDGVDTQSLEDLLVWLDQ